MITQNALLIRREDQDNDQCLIGIGEVEALQCFAPTCPFEQEEDEAYDVRLTPRVFGAYDVALADPGAEPGIEQLPGKDGYVHRLTGVLAGDTLQAAGVLVQDARLRHDFAHLDGKIVTWTVDRIDIAFDEA
jgi:hypothetical protein